jgi:aldehyde dehydrogenase (NAD+)
MSLPALDPSTQNLIDGRLVAASDGGTFPNVNPATEEVLGVTANGTRDDIDRAIAAARHAFDATSWSQDHVFRAHCLRQLRDALWDEREQLRAIVVAEGGVPMSITGFVHVDDPIEMLHYWADRAGGYAYERDLAETSFRGVPQRRVLRREAAGVVGAITPWNVPLYLAIAKLGPALAAGCTIVLKPAPETPWSTLYLARLAAERTDLPAGVLNVVASAEHALGEMLSADPRIDLVTFTGSTATGRRVMERASATVKKVFLELGGKSANVVLDDADFAKVLGGAASICIHGGQGCAITTRLLLPRSRWDEGIALAKTSFERWPYGDPTDPANLQGPQISRKQQQRVLGYVAQAQRDGARCLTGGRVPAHLSRGFFVEPTLIVGADPRSAIAQEEVFGPVLVALPYDDDADAVRIANDSIYGLSGAVHGSDARALAVARAIRTGTMSVNGGGWFHVDTPFGGYKQSGVGRENGALGFEEYLETKVIALPASRGSA